MNKEALLNTVNLNGRKGDYFLKKTAGYVRMIINLTLHTAEINKKYRTSWIQDINEDSLESRFEGKEFYIKTNKLFSKDIYSIQVRRDTKYIDFAKQEIGLKKQGSTEDSDLTEIISSTLNEFGFKLTNVPK